MSDAILLSSNWELLNLNFPNVSNTAEIVWLVGHYAGFTWNYCQKEETELKLEEFFGFLSFKYRESGFESRDLAWLNWLNKNDEKVIDTIKYKWEMNAAIGTVGAGDWLLSDYLRRD